MTVPIDAQLSGQVNFNGYMEDNDLMEETGDTCEKSDGRKKMSENLIRLF